MAQQQTGGIELTEVLGVGAFGRVLAGVLRGELGSTKPVAVKEITLGPKEGALERVLAEAQLGCGLSHPNLVTTLTCGGSPDGLKVQIVMELVQGWTLLKLIDKRSVVAMPMTVMLEIIEQACAGLYHLHRPRKARRSQPAKPAIVHRDLKPANIMVTYEGIVKVMDFGIARPVSQTETAVMGTPTYMSPEQAAEHAELGPSSDLFALGLVLFELLTGEKFLKGKTSDVLLQLAGHDASQVATRLDDRFPQSVREIVVCALQRDPAHRYQSAREMGEALAQARRVLKGPSLESWAETLVERDLASSAVEKVGPDGTRAAVMIPMAGEVLEGLASALVTPLPGGGGDELDDSENGTPDVVVPNPGGSADLSRDPTATLDPVPTPEEGRVKTDRSQAPREPSRGRWVAIAGVLLLAAGGLALWGKLHTPTQTAVLVATPELTPVATPEVVPESTPEPTPVVQVSRATPRATPRPEPVKTPEPTPVATPEVVPGSTPEPTPVVVAMGHLLVASQPWAHAVVDGKDLGATPLINVPLPAGEHTLELRCGPPDLCNGAPPKTQRFTLQPGGTFRSTDNSF